MSKANQPKTATPRLRFPEFEETGEYEHKPLRELAESVTDRAGDADVTPYTVTGGEGLISQEEKLGRTIAGKSLKNYYRLKVGDFAFNKSATKANPEGYIARLHDDVDAAVPNSIFTCFRRTSEEIDGNFLDWLFQANLHGDWLRRFITVGARAHGALNISDDDLFALPIPLPPDPAEQRKIAACLGSLDDWIAAESRRLAALRRHKTGLMQHLFPRPGQTRPRLRFSEFQNAGEWEEKPVSTFFGKVRNGFVGTATPFYSVDGIPYLQGKNVKSGRIDPTGIIYVTKAFHAKQRKSQLVPGDILMVQSGHVGECAVVDEEFGGSNCHALLVLTPRDRRVSPYFKQYFYSPHGLAQIARITTGNTIRHILASEVKTLDVVAPEPAEQRRIADCLAALDARLSAQSAKLAALRHHKRGLMQQLFPSPEGQS